MMLALAGSVHCIQGQTKSEVRCPPPTLRGHINVKSHLIISDLIQGLRAFPPPALPPPSTETVQAGGGERDG